MRATFSLQVVVTGIRCKVWQRQKIFLAKCLILWCESSFALLQHFHIFSLSDVHDIASNPLGNWNHNSNKTMWQKAKRRQKGKKTKNPKNIVKSGKFLTISSESNMSTQMWHQTHFLLVCRCNFAASLNFYNITFYS